MTPEEYKKNIHVRLRMPLVGAFVVSLLMVIIGYYLVYLADNMGMDLYGNYDDWVMFNTYTPFTTIIFFIVMILNFKKEPDDPREAFN